MLLLLPAIAPGQVDEQAFKADLQAIGSISTRTVGSDGYYQTIDYVERQLRSLGDRIEYRRHEYPVMVPVTGSATVTLGADQHRVYPIWPAGVRLNATPAEGITSEIVYVREAKFSQLKPGAIRGRIAAVEAHQGDWQQAAYFGARAILILESPTTTNASLRSHDLVIPINLPRFFVPAGPLADAIRSDVATQATLKASVDWQQRTAVNFYAVVKPAKQRPDGWNASSTNPAALMFSAGMESSSLVPDLSPGAGQAVQTAAALAMLREYAAKPVDRPVAFFFAGADSLNNQATRQMFMALADYPAKWRSALSDLLKQDAEARRDFERLLAAQHKPETLNAEDDRTAIDRVRKIVETDATLELDEVFQRRLVPEDERTEEQKQKLRDLESRQAKLSNLRYRLDKDPASLVEEEVRGDAITYIGRALARLQGTNGQPGLLQQQEARRAQFEARIALFEWFAGVIGRDKNPSISQNNSRLIELLVALDLTGDGVRVGPMFWGTIIRAANISQIQDYNDWILRQHRMFKAGEGARWLAPHETVLDVEPLNNARSPNTWLVAPLPIRSELGPAWGVPALSMVTLDDLRLMRDTPSDTLANLKNVDGAILPQLQAVSALFRAAANDAKFKGPVELKWETGYVPGQVVGAYAGRPVPDLPREGFLASLMYVENSGKSPKLRGISDSYWMGTRKIDLVQADADGKYLFEGLPKIGNGDDHKHRGVQVYKFSPGTGDIIAASDAGKQAADIKWVADLNQEATPLKSVVFNCAEFSLFGLYDPRFLQGLGEVTLLDAQRNDEPQRYNYILRNQMMSGFVEPGMRLLLIFRYGRVGNRLLMLNIDKETAGGSLAEGARGFTVQELNDIGPLALTTTKDFADLNGIRLGDYREAGVSSELVDQLHEESAQKIVAAEEAIAANDGAALVKHANGAWADEARVYQAAQDMANDVIRAAIFLLLLCVPFAFSMERLLFAVPNIYKQIALAMGIFALMTSLLWSFHPAFELSSSPLIIILAFAIIFMSIVVIYMVYGKFDTELKKIRSGRGNVEGASFARASVLTSAVLLGIANMRRRLFRTVLTSITIVLITFAVLCFTSATRYVGTTTLPTGIEPDHPGIMLRQRGFRSMPGPVLENLRVVLGPEKRVVERHWNVNAGDPNDQFHLVAGGRGTDGAAPRVYPIQALLGLSPGESELSSIDEVIGAEKYKAMEDGREDIIYLSRAVAEQLSVNEGDTIRLGGIPLQLAGIFDANDFDLRCKMLSGEPLAPLKYTQGALDAAGRKLTDQGAEDLSLDANSTAAEMTAGAYEHLPATRFAIVPAQVAKLLPNNSLRSVAFRCKDQQEVKTIADDLSRRFAVALFAGYEEGVKMVAASNLASVSGAGQVAVPLAIAGLIVFNTMMGSIAERRREIHVYTSLGLAPVHVGALFVAEALTYGLIGTVFGYIIGQGFGTLLMKWGWLGGVTLNYSGTSAMMTMGLILLIVLLSALVPARLASKLAAPSMDRAWRVPAPKDDEIIAQLPFTINKTAADGALAYLADFFEAHQEGSIGKFSAGKVEPFTFADETGGMSRGIKTIIWLTPFDLGVRQHLMLLIHPGQYPDIYEVQVVLQRLSGNDGSWYRMNRSFLTELRKQFLQWRSLSPQRMLEYVEESKRLFGATPDRVVTMAKGEEVRLA